MAECEECDGRKGLRGNGFEFLTVKDVSVMLRVSYSKFLRRVLKFRCTGLCRCDATRVAIEDIQKEQKQQWKGQR
jgi:hypothetical protein